MTKKYLYALLICLTLTFTVVPKVFGQSDRACTYNPEAYRGLELERLAGELNATGLLGRVHGAASKSQMFVMSVREPDNFFSHREFSLLASNSSVTNTLQNLNRHDLVCISGDLIPNPSPQKHIAVNSLKVIEPWAQPAGFTPYERQTDIPTELKNKTSLTGKVHAIGSEGKVLAMEYGDGIIPIFARNTQYTQGLYRGDIIKLNYTVQQRPQQPTHLKLDTNNPQPIEIINAIAPQNGQQQTLTGSLVKFPRSPQLKFDVYAIAVASEGIDRYFTLINFENMTEFQNIRTKLARIWDENQATAVSGRNMLINPAVRIEASGTVNIVSTEQANPQILLDSAGKVRQIM